MVVHKASTKANAKAMMRRYSKRGYNTSCYKKKGQKGYAISVSRRGKNKK